MFTKTKGCLYLNVDSALINQTITKLKVQIPTEWSENRLKRDGPDYHLTVIPKKDFKNNIDNKFPVNEQIFPLGVVLKDDVTFLPCFYPAGILFCDQYQIPVNDFHVTLGFSSVDNHEIKKDFTQLHDSKYIDWENFVLVLEYFENKISKLDKSSSLVKIFNNFYQHFESKVENLALLAQLYQVYAKYLIKFNQKKLENHLYKMLELEETQEMATLVLLKMNFLKQPDTILKKYKIHDMEKALKIKSLLNQKFPANRFQYSILDGQIQKLKIPNNFSQITSNLYASGLVNSSHLPFILSKGITSIINLTEDSRSSIKDEIDYHHFPIVDREATSFKNINEIIKLIKRPQHITLVHCLGGKGRTAMAFYSYLIREMEMDISQIDDKYRKEREVLMAEPQLSFLRDFIKHPFGNNYKKLIKHKGSSCPKAFILVGIPGSGKSSFSKHLEKYLGNDLVYLNQDTQGRKELTRLISVHSRNKKIVIVDRCNLTKKDRQEWLSYFNDPVWCIYFNIPPEECFYRIEHRKGHPTLSGPGGVKIAKGMLINLESPELREGFQQIIKITSETDLNHILSTWHMSPILVKAEDNFFKFPRTVHLYNLGSATRDDLLLDKKQQLEFLNKKVYAEEKIDGANMGISIDPTDMSIKFQNRSHFVNNKYHSQFEHLDAWRDQHSRDLYEILAPGRHILFGKWLYLQHSIHYKKLPRFFIAFDLYDRKEKKFYSRPRLEKLLKRTNIPLVRCIQIGEFSKLSELVNLIQTESLYRGDGGPVEGVYVKQSDDGEWVTRRGKIVREDFIDGNQFWDKGIVQKNLIDYTSLYDD